ncbi:ANTAR domain-containing protein [Streptomyces swartbergensis]|uniref:ANTAR domain-containing protein n=1 Tax=Streptomyces swartbergensis TaxID=487165 RepID=UPI0038252F5F
MSTAGPAAADDDSELERPRAEVRDLRARARVYPLISQAQGTLQERYALPDAESAFALMQRASQRYNVKLRTLAGFLVTAPRPDGREQLWFPHRVRRPEPALTFTSAHRSGSGSRGTVLKAVLSHTLAVTGADMGNVQLTELRIEEHTGHTPEFVDFFAHVGDDGTACARAARDVTPVTVRDVEATRCSASLPARSSSRRAAEPVTASR